MIAYSHGNIQLMRNIEDTAPIAVRFPNVTLTSAQWSPGGGFFAASGYNQDAPLQERLILVIGTAFGDKLRVLKSPGNTMNDCAWDPTGLKIAMAIDNCVFYATIRPDYLWCYGGHSVVYAYSGGQQDEYTVVFYETRLQESYTKHLRGLKALTGHGDYVCYVCAHEESKTSTEMYAVQLCNGIGTPVDFKTLEIDPKFVEMNSTSAVFASPECFVIWHFSLPRKVDMGLRLAGKNADGALDQVFYLDNFFPVITEKRRKGADSICCICLGDNFFLAATDSGSLYQFSLQSGALLNRFIICAHPEKMRLSMLNRKLAVLDNMMVLKFYEMHEDKAEPIPHEDKKEIWSFCWDQESDDSIAVNEKGKMMVYRNGEPEEGQLTTGYICQFRGLAVRSVLVDNFLHHRKAPEKRFIIDMEIKVLREAKLMLERQSITDAVAFIEKQEHPRLWELLVEHALLKLNIAVAEHAYVKLKDYGGIQFCKKLQDIQDVDMQRAEVYAHLGKINEAEQIYKKADRMDLVIEMRKKYNEWLTLLHTLEAEKMGKLGDDELLKEARNQVGDYYAEKLNWKNAMVYYQRTDNFPKVLQCAIQQDDFDVILALPAKVPDGDPFLLELAEVFYNAGLCDEAVNCYLRCEKLNEALDCCIKLNQWEMAVNLSRTHNLRDVDALLGKYTAELTGSNERTLAAVQLYKRAGKYLDAARIVYDIASEERRKAAPLLRLQKLYVMAALLIEDYHNQTRNKAAEKNGRRDSAKVALTTLLSEDTSLGIDDSRMIERAWRGAEAYHFFMLAHRQMYAGEVEAAMKTSLYLTEFEDLLEPIEVYSLLALAACGCGQFEQASRAFMKLESLPNSPEVRESYEKLAMRIFLKFPPNDTKLKYVDCSQCQEPMQDFEFACPACDYKLPVCVVTGQPLHDFQFWLCPTCKHRAYEDQISRCSFCPLCHTKIDNSIMPKSMV
ncbi:hypothetical protein PMAYCL1PPCAC_04584 [Pristionchus mayeri]|uniref:WD repeat-containing protein 35 n=1 Tax=Pristionchus mayeri TaxID=1317129 RepID=A0AAN4Z6T3_9BILA|nr:hypothetical protein PMAYCL1PPCAC_04584 [Pristionchus mayeri]